MVKWWEKDLFDVGAQSQPGERQTDIELIIAEKTEYYAEPDDGGCAEPDEVDHDIWADEDAAYDMKHRYQ